TKSPFAVRVCPFSPENNVRVVKNARMIEFRINLMMVERFYQRQWVYVSDILIPCSARETGHSCDQLDRLNGLRHVNLISRGENPHTVFCASISRQRHCRNAT